MEQRGNWYDLRGHCWGRATCHIRGDLKDCGLSSQSSEIIEGKLF